METPTLPPRLRATLMRPKTWLVSLPKRANGPGDHRLDALICRIPCRPSSSAQCIESAPVRSMPPEQIKSGTNGGLPMLDPAESRP
jgi:hypothetical protein